MEAVGISQANAKQKFSKESNFEVVTIQKEKLVHLREEDEVVFKGITWRRFPKGKTFVWGR